MKSLDLLIDEFVNIYQPFDQPLFDQPLFDQPFPPLQPPSEKEQECSWICSQTFITKLSQEETYVRLMNIRRLMEHG